MFVMEIIGVVIFIDVLVFLKKKDVSEFYFFVIV